MYLQTRCIRSHSLGIHLGKHLVDGCLVDHKMEHLDDRRVACVELDNLVKKDLGSNLWGIAEACHAQGRECNR